MTTTINDRQAEREQKEIREMDNEWEGKEEKKKEKKKRVGEARYLSHRSARVCCRLDACVDVYT